VLGQLYVAGEFGLCAGTTAPALAKLDADTGAVNTSFTQSPGIDISAVAIASDDYYLYVSGPFYHYRGVAVNSMIKVLLSDGSRDTGFNVFSNIGDAATAMAVAPSTLFLGGPFTVGAYTNFAGVTYDTGGLSAAHQSSANSPVRAIRERRVCALRPAAISRRSTALPPGPLVRIFNSGERDASFAIGKGFVGNITSLTAADAGLVVGGTINDFDDIPVGGAVMLNTITGHLP